MNATYVDEAVKRDNEGIKVAAGMCIGGTIMHTVFGNPLAGLIQCAIGAPFYGLAAEIIKGEKTSPVIKAAGVLAFLDPLIGAAVAGLGMVLGPTKFYIDQHWHHDWHNKTIMLPWGIEKR